MTSLALYAVADEYMVALNRLAELDLDPQTVADTLESLSGDLEAKATNVGLYIRNIGALVAGMKDAEASMKARREKAEKHVENLSAYLKANMERTGVTKIEGPMLALQIKKNPPAVVIDAPDLVPAFFWKLPPPPPPPVRGIDKAAIKAAIAEGEEVPGARLVQGTRLEIKS